MHIQLHLGLEPQGLPAKLGIPVKGRNRPSLAARSPKRKRGVINDSDESSKANSDPEIAVMDLAQDSDNHNSKLKPTGKATRGVAVTEFDDVALYFESPKRAVGAVSSKLILSSFLI
ncbi:hypothetical protein H4Q26_010762 [Puccinia striiformis f. sp. tritici PST-130]|nr:hypothetical protein H4Q26_010762 [Puccinia striiformis f. sp. tritici PST-130]